MGLNRNIVRIPDKIGVIALLLVYLVWGSTYLAISQAVRGDGAIPPFALGAMRMAIASAILFAVAATRGERLRLTKRGAGIASAAGVLFWVGGNGLVIVGLAHIDTGLAAVLMATTPMWLAVLTTLQRLRIPSARMLLGLALGISGVAVLVASTSSDALSGSGIGIALVLVAAFSWALGSLLPSPGASSLVNAASIMFFASVSFAIISALRGEAFAIPSARAMLALGYLAVVGSAIGFVAYLIATERLALPLVMTHAQVNPLVAVLLGAIFLGESLSPLTALAGLLIVVSIPLSRG